MSVIVFELVSSLRTHPSTHQNLLLLPFKPWGLASAGLQYEDDHSLKVAKQVQDCSIANMTPHRL